MPPTCIPYHDYLLPQTRKLHIDLVGCVSCRYARNAKWDFSVTKYLSSWSPSLPANESKMLAKCNIGGKSSLLSSCSYLLLGVEHLFLKKVKRAILRRRGLEGRLLVKRHAGAGSAPFVRGFAWLGVGGGGGGSSWSDGGGGGWTRGLSSSTGALSASSLNDKLAANPAAATRAARDIEHLTPGEKAARGEGVGDRATGGAAPGGWRGYGADTRGGGSRGGGMRGGGGSGTDPSTAAAARPSAVLPGSPLNTRIDGETDSMGLLQLVTDELPKFSAINLSHAFCKLGKLGGSRHVPDDRFRGLMVRVRETCVDGQLEIQDMSNIMHAVAKMRAAGKLATEDAGVEDMLAALEQRVVHVAPNINSHGVSNLILAFRALGRLPGAAARAALEAAVVRVAPSMLRQQVVNALHGHARLGWAPGDAALAALEAGAHTRPLVCTT